MKKPLEYSSNGFHIAKNLQNGFTIPNILAIVKAPYGGGVPPIDTLDSNVFVVTIHTV
jgi:hypothetical protein